MHKTKQQQQQSTSTAPAAQMRSPSKHSSKTHNMQNKQQVVGNDHNQNLALGDTSQGKIDLSFYPQAEQNQSHSTNKKGSKLLSTANKYSTQKLPSQNLNSSVKERVRTGDSKGKSKRRSTQQHTAQPYSNEAHQIIRALDPGHLNQSAQHPVFSPKTTTQSSVPTMRQAQSKSKERQQKKHFFNQTTSLVGLSSHLLGTDTDELEEEDPSYFKRVHAPGGNNEYLSETQVIDMSSLNLMMPLYQTPGPQVAPPQVMGRTRKTVSKGPAPATERAIKGLKNDSTSGIEQSEIRTITGHQKAPSGNELGKISSGNRGLISDNFQQARLDELISQVKAAAGFGFQTSANSTGSTSGIGGTSMNGLQPQFQQVSTSSVEKSNTSSISLKRKPSIQGSKKHLVIPGVTYLTSGTNSLVESKKLSLKQQVQLHQQQIIKQKEASMLRDNSLGVKGVGPEKRESLNLTSTSGPHQQDNGGSQHRTTLPQNQLQSLGDSTVHYKNLTQKMIKEHQMMKQTTSLTSAGSSKFNLHHPQSSSLASKKASSSSKQRLNNQHLQQTQPLQMMLAYSKLNDSTQNAVVDKNKRRSQGAGGGGKSSLNRTQVLQQPSAGVTTTTNKNQKSFGFEILTQVNSQQQIPQKRQASKGANSKKLLNLTGTLPKGLLSPANNMVTSNNTVLIPSNSLPSGKQHHLQYVHQIEGGANYNNNPTSFHQIQSQLPVNLRNPAMMSTNSSNNNGPHGSNGGITGSSVQCQNLIYSDIRDYNVINTYIGCFPPFQQMPQPQRSEAEKQQDPTTLLLNAQLQQLNSSRKPSVGKPERASQSVESIGGGADQTEQQQIYAPHMNSQQLSIKNYKTQKRASAHPPPLAPPQPQSQKKKRSGHHKTSTLPNAAILLLNEILQQNNNPAVNLVPQHAQQQQPLHVHEEYVINQVQHQQQQPNSGVMIKTVGQTPRHIYQEEQEEEDHSQPQWVAPQSKQMKKIGSTKTRPMSGSNAQQRVSKQQAEANQSKITIAEELLQRFIMSNKKGKGANSTVMKTENVEEGDKKYFESEAVGGFEFQESLQMDPKIRTAKLANIGKILNEPLDNMATEEDLKVTSGCGVIISYTEQSTKKLKDNIDQECASKGKSPKNLPATDLYKVQTKKLHRRQRSRSNGSSSNGACESRSRSLGKVAEDPLVALKSLRFPITPAKALKTFMTQLTDYEKGEILDYKQIYFLGIGAQKIKGSPLHPYNFGFDDERGDYKVVMKDHIAYRFEVIEFLGKGSFGQALKCFDHKTQELVAVKLIRNKKRFQHQAGVELKILMHLKQNDPDDAFNIIRIKDYVVFRKHLVISFELFSINLYEFIKNNNFQGVSLSLIRRFAIQMLQALKYLREQNIIHCDLKPENILLKSPDKSGIKIIDFGSSCFQEERIYTYIQSRFYRAPEIILGIPYTPAIDMWSFGSILVELFTGYPIFPGENEQEQLSLIMEVRGHPPEQILDQSTRRKIFFDEETDEPLLLTTDSRGKLRIPGTKPLHQILNGCGTNGECSSQNFIDFIERCLDWDPQTRITPYEALLHDWIIEGLPPKVLLHHKRMLGVQEEQPSFRLNNKVGMVKQQLVIKRSGLAKHIKEKIMNRTCLLSDAIHNDEPLVEQPEPVYEGRKGVGRKAQLNMTGHIVLNSQKTEEEDNILVDFEPVSSSQKKQQPLQVNKVGNTNIPPPLPIIQALQSSSKKKAKQDFFGEKEKSKTTNISDLLQEAKRAYHHHEGDESVNIDHNSSAAAGAFGKIKLDNTYDFTKVNKTSFLSQNDFNEDDEDLDAALLVPFDERDHQDHLNNNNATSGAGSGGASLVKKQHQLKGLAPVPLNFLNPPPPTLQVKRKQEQGLTVEVTAPQQLSNFINKPRRRQLEVNVGGAQNSSSGDISVGLQSVKLNNFMSEKTLVVGNNKSNSSGSDVQ